jgi:hypothetical protein
MFVHSFSSFWLPFAVGGDRVDEPQVLFGAADNRMGAFRFSLTFLAAQHSQESITIKRRR